MEIISYGIVSTAYENWSYDEMSEPEMTGSMHATDPLHCFEKIDPQPENKPKLAGDLEEEASTRSRVFECAQCGKGFKARKKLLRHRKYHYYPWKCTQEECINLSWRTEKERDRHVRVMHTAPTRPQYRCVYSPCTYASQRRSRLEQHMKNAHVFEYFCSKRYDERDAYETNFWTGTPTPPSPASSINSALRDPYPATFLGPASDRPDSQDFGGDDAHTFHDEVRSLLELESAGILLELESAGILLELEDNRLADSQLLDLLRFSEYNYDGFEPYNVTKSPNIHEHELGGTENRDGAETM